MSSGLTYICLRNLIICEYSIIPILNDVILDHNRTLFLLNTNSIIEFGMIHLKG